MKRKLLLLLAFGLIFSAIQTLAAVSPYAWGFEKAPTRNNAAHQYIVGTGWGYYYDNPSGDRTTWWNYSTGTNTQGVNRTNAIMLYGSATSEYIDCIVTPEVTGDVAIKVKKTSASATSGIKFYTMTKHADGTFDIGSLIDAQVPTLSTSYQVVTIGNFTAGTYVGICGYNVYVDDFTAGSADVELVKSLKINSVSNNNGNYVDADNAGNFIVKYTINLQNTGDYDIAAREASVQMIDRRDSKVMATVPVATAIAMSKTARVVVTDTLNLAQYPAGGTYYFDFKETLTGTVNNTDRNGVKPVAYVPKFAMINQQLRDTLATGATINFKLSKTDVTKSYVLRNDGAAPLSITELKLSDGYTASLKAPLTVNKHSQLTLNITQSASTPGSKSGTLELKTNDYDLALALKGRIVDSDAWFYNVDNQGYNLPGNMVNAGGWTTWGLNTSMKPYEDNNSALKADAKGTGKLISPMLEFKAGSTLEFRAARVDTAASWLKVYYSTDRKHWTLASHITGDMLDGGTFTPSNATAVYYCFKSFGINTIASGNCYVAFEGANVYLDDLVGPKPVARDHDLYMSAQHIPTQGAVNSKLQAMARVVNTLETVEAAGSYRAELHVGQEVFPAETPEIKGYGTVGYAFAFTPHKAGTFDACIVLDFGTYKLSSDTVQIVVASESGNRYVDVGSSTVGRYEAPVQTMSLFSQSEALYLASELKLKPGTKITGITYRGANGVGSMGAAWQATPLNLKVYLQNTSDSIYTAPYAASTTTEADLGYNGNCTVLDGGEIGSWNSTIGGCEITQSADKIDITFSKPIVYAGNNLRIVVAAAVTDNTKAVTNYFEADHNVEDRCIVRSGYTESAMTTTAYQAVPLPVAHLKVESTASVMSGKITAAGAPVQDAVVTITAADVQYTATTAADGTYSIAVYQDARLYKVNVEARGFYPLNGELKIDADVTANYELQKATGLYVKELNVPSRGNVNSPVVVSAVGKNYTQATIDNYTATLYVAGQETAHAQAVPVEPGAEASYTFTFTPHATGTFPVYVELKLTDENKYASNPVGIAVDEEVMTAVAIAGDSDRINNSETPVAWNYRYSESQTLYTAQQLSMPAGAKVKRIYFKGYSSGNNQYDAYVHAFLLNASNYTMSSTPIDTATATPVYEGVVHVEAKGKFEAPVVVLDLPVDTDFVYTGGDLILLVHSYAGSYNNTSFVADGSILTQSYCRRNDSRDRMATTNWNSTSLPVAHIEYTTYVQVTGKVTEAVAAPGAPTMPAPGDGAPIAGATLTFVNGDVSYTATTDANGDYSLKIGRKDLDFTVTVSASGYDDLTRVVPSDQLAMAQNFELTRKTLTGVIDVKENEVSRGPQGIYSIDGRLVRAGNDTTGLSSGVYIVDGKKLIVK